MTHDESRLRRQRIAEALKAGVTCAAIAELEGITLSHVYNCAAEFNVKINRNKGAAPKSSLKILKMLVDGMPAKVVALRLGVSISRVSHVKKFAIEAGWEL